LAHIVGKAVGIYGIVENILKVGSCVDMLTLYITTLGT
jgi:hypothetical protein